MEPTKHLSGHVGHSLRTTIQQVQAIGSEFNQAFAKSNAAALGLRDALLDAEREILRHNSPALKQQLQQTKQCKYQFYWQDGEIRYRPDQLEKHRRRMKYRRRYERIGRKLANGG